MGNINQINIKRRTYYFFNEMIYMKNFNADLLKIYKKSYKNFYIFYIGYILAKYYDDQDVGSLNPIYLSFL